MTGELIYARASGDGASAIAVIRLSGYGAGAVLKELCGGALPAPRRASLKKLRHPETDEILDEALVLYFAPGASYTGEESCELHVHGGGAVADPLFGALEQLGARLARPGEFTRRAMAAGRLDLSQAEAVSALISAASDAERRQALRVLQGEVGEQARAWRDMVISIIGLLETGVDFVDERLGDDLIVDAASQLRALSDDFERHIADAQAWSAVPDRPTIVLAGPPNAGKSSLLNVLVGRDRAIVSSAPGTTRDTVDVAIQSADRTFTLVDTAGVRDTDDETERAGVLRSRDAMRAADHRVFVVSADTVDRFQPLTSEIRAVDAIFWTKADLAPPTDPFWASLTLGEKAVVSKHAPDETKKAFQSYLERAMDRSAAALSPLSGSERRIGALEGANRHLRIAIDMVAEGHIELALDELKSTRRRIESLTGAIEQEDVLDALFSQFCIGK